MVHDVVVSVSHCTHRKKKKKLVSVSISMMHNEARAIIRPASVGAGGGGHERPFWPFCLAFLSPSFSLHVCVSLSLSLSLSAPFGTPPPPINQDRAGPPRSLAVCDSCTHAGPSSFALLGRACVGSLSCQRKQLLPRSCSFLLAIPPPSPSFLPSFGGFHI